jgi:DHA1 family tetracycline resistance protein-like MFS transporter
MNLVGGIPYTYFSLYIEELGGTPFIIGVINFVSFAALASVQFLGGYLADAYGRRWLLVSMTFGVALSNLIFAFAPSWELILVAVLVQNLCLIYQPALSAITADSIPPKKRGLGFSTIMFLSNLASLASPLIAGILFLHYGTLEGVRVGFLIVAVFYLAAASIRIKLKETLKKTKTQKKGLKNVLKAYPQALKEGFQVWGLLPRSMLFLFVINVIGSFSYALIGAYLVLYATQNLGVKEFEWAVLMTWLTAVMILGALPSGKLVDKYGRAKCLLISWLVYVPFPLLFLYGKLLTLYVGFFLFGVSNALFMPGYSAIEADLVPKELRGKEVGCSQFVTYSLMALGGLTGGFLYENVSPASPFFVSFRLVMVCLLLQILFIRESDK